MAKLLTTYSSLRLRVVDVCIVALADRLDLREVAGMNPLSLRRPRAGADSAIVSSSASVQPERDRDGAGSAVPPP